jgi:hypothetical protein
LKNAPVEGAARDRRVMAEEFDKPVHWLAASFPMMSEEKLAELAADIRANGLNNPITIGDWEQDGETIRDGLIDGRNRFAACKRAGVEPRFTKLNGQDPETYIVSQNVKRRDITVSQRAIVAAEAWARAERTGRVQTKGGDRRSKAQSAHLIKDPRRHFGKEYEVGEKYVVMAMELLTLDPPAVEAVRNGAEKLRDAHAKAAKRQGSLLNQQTRIRKLWRERSDLAERIEAEEIDLESAERQATKEAEEQKQLRWAFTLNVIDAVRGFDREITDIEQYAELFDFAHAESRQEEITRERLLNVADFAVALADALFPEERERDQ